MESSFVVFIKIIYEFICLILILLICLKLLMAKIIEKMFVPRLVITALFVIVKDKENRGGKEYWTNVSVRLKTEIKNELKASPH